MEDKIKEILLNLTHVNYEESFIKERNVRSISVQKDKVEISIELNFPIVLLENEFKALIANEIETLIKIPVKIYLTQKILMWFLD